VSVTDYALDYSKVIGDLQAFDFQGIQVVVGPINAGAINAILHTQIPTTLSPD